LNKSNLYNASHRNFSFAARLKEMKVQIEHRNDSVSEKRHKQSKLTAWERLELLFDPGTFQEIDRFVTNRNVRHKDDKHTIFGDGVITGMGKIDGRFACAFSQDFSVYGGSLSESQAEKICKIMDIAT
jgi:acetyl-CoA carboxylase carboxyltransferase component